MAASIAAANTAAATAFVAALATAGVTDACVTPGSRSTPLTVALARQSAIKPWLHLDERSSAFFALGLARATRRPVALVCTSGTAAANFHPAVVEANLSRIPLIICTADRPPRLRDVGAAQTMDQVNMFGTSVRWSSDLPLPVGRPGEERQFAAAAERSVHVAMGPLQGPVHLNFPFEEPLLEPPGEAIPPTPPTARTRQPREFVAAPPREDVRHAAEILGRARRPLIVAGPETGGLPAKEIAALAAALDAPILADPLSGLRTGSHGRTRVLAAYDAVLRGAVSPDLAPDCVLRFGAMPTSKALAEFLACQGHAHQILCEHPGGWRDPGGLSGLVVFGTPALVSQALVDELPQSMSETGWLDRWLIRDHAACCALRVAAEAAEDLFEGRVFTELQTLLPPGATIVAGNSMPIRDLDSFLASGDRPLNLVANRGAAGIDGVTSSALGAAAAGAGPVVLVIGDISFYHDLNGLWAAARHRLNLTIVLVNNNGGGIFHYLPQAAHEDLFEEWFGTPPSLDFSHAVTMFGGRFTRATDWAAFRCALADGLAGGLHVIELPTDRVRNTELHRAAWAAAARAVEAIG